MSIATTKTMMVTVVFRPPREVAGLNMAGAFRRWTRRAIQILFARPLRRPHLPSGRLYGDRTKIVALGNFNAAMAQNCISGCDMEMEVRQQKMDEIIGAVHVPRGRAEREGDLTLGR